MAIGALTAIVTMAVAACGSSEGSETAGESGGGIEFTYVTGAPGPAQAMGAEALENVNEEFGYRGKWVQIQNSDLVVQGMTSGKFDLASGTTSAVMAAMQKGASLTFIGEEERNSWTLTGKSEYEGCQDLDDVRLGLHSAGGVSTAIYKSWFGKNCASGIEPKILYIEGSPNRLQALLVDQLDVAMMEVGDTTQLPADGYHIIANFAEQLSEVKTTLIYGSNDFLKRHPELVQRWLAEVDKLHREVNEDPSVLADIIRRRLPEMSEGAQEIAEAVVKYDLEPEDVSISVADLDASAEVYAGADILESGFESANFLNTDLASAAAESLE